MQMLEKWQQLNEREQKLVLAMSVVIGIFLFYSLVWQPLNNNIAKTSDKIERQQQLLSWVESETSRYQQARQSGQLTNKGGSLSSVVNGSANQQGIVIDRMQPQGSDLQVWIEQVPFDQLMAWLDQLMNNNGVKVKAIDVTNTDTAGVVNVRRLQLGRG